MYFICVLCCCTTVAHTDGTWSDKYLVSMVLGSIRICQVKFLIKYFSGNFKWIQVKVYSF